MGYKVPLGLAPPCSSTHSYHLLRQAAQASASHSLHFTAPSLCCVFPPMGWFSHCTSLDEPSLTVPVKLTAFSSLYHTTLFYFCHSTFYIWHYVVCICLLFISSIRNIKFLESKGCAPLDRIIPGTLWGFIKYLLSEWMNLYKSTTLS